MRVVILGMVEFSGAMFDCVAGIAGIEICGAVTRRAGAASDFHSLETQAGRLDVPVFLADGKSNDEMANWLRGLAPDLMLCVGWPRLLPFAVLNAPRLGTIGYHPAALPANRGRHPIIWALALGLQETCSTFFLMDEGADSGPIVSQHPVSIGPDETARELYDKLVREAETQLRLFLPQLAGGTCKMTPQDERGATYWRKRGVRDGEIDWRMPARGVHNLVRALTRPYPGAHIAVEDGHVKVWRTRVEAGAPVNAEPGKVLAIEGGAPLVKCGEGAVWLVEHELAHVPGEGGYL